MWYSTNRRYLVPCSSLEQSARLPLVLAAPLFEEQGYPRTPALVTQIGDPSGSVGFHVKTTSGPFLLGELPARRCASTIGNPMP